MSPTVTHCIEETIEPSCSCTCSLPLREINLKARALVILNQIIWHHQYSNPVPVTRSITARTVLSQSTGILVSCE